VHADQAHVELLAGTLKQISEIKPGVTRKDFEKTFVVDGGNWQSCRPALLLSSMHEHQG